MFRNNTCIQQGKKEPFHSVKRFWLVNTALEASAFSFDLLVLQPRQSHDHLSIETPNLFCLSNRMKCGAAAHHRQCIFFTHSLHHNTICTYIYMSNDLFENTALRLQTKKEQ
jgi:hypothetical protein